MNIILVDDDLDDIMLFRQAINDINKAVNCVEFEGGHDLLNYLEVATYQPKMIFLDYNMPGMNGLECLQELRKRPQFRHLPVIIYTTYLSSEQESSCLALGASVLLKPSTYSDLIDAIEAKIFQIATPLN